MVETERYLAVLPLAAAALAVVAIEGGHNVAVVTGNYLHALVSGLWIVWDHLKGILTLG